MIRVKKAYQVKLILLFVAFIISTPFLNADGLDNNIIHSNQYKSAGNIQNSFLINEFDTVVFDLAKAIINGNEIEFPVSIISDDSIFSLDFSLQFDQANLQYDTIIDNVSYLQSLSHYNTSDSTIRYTSNSFQNYGIDSAITSIRFISLSGHIKKEDLNDVYAYLNGTSCSTKIINSLPTIGEESVNVIIGLRIFPIPANDVLNINSNEDISIQLFDINYRQIHFEKNIKADENYEMNLNKYSSGVYFLKIFNKHSEVIKKMLIEK